MASIGIEILKIQVLARWESDVVLRYVREAPLAAIATDVKRARPRHAEIGHPQLAIEDIKEEIAAKVIAELAQRAPQSECPAASRRVAIRNPATNTVHSAPADRGMIPPRCCTLLAGGGSAAACMTSSPKPPRGHRDAASASGRKLKPNVPGLGAA